MAQYKTGTATFTNGSATVTGTGTEWLANVSIGDWIIRRGSPGVSYPVYRVGGIVSDTEITLTAPYGGVTASDVNYTVHISFLPNGTPELENGDVESASIQNEANANIPKGIGTDPDQVPTNADLYVDSLADLPSPVVEGQRVAFHSYYPGWAVSGDGLPKGGGVVVGVASGVHDGGTKFDPTRSADIGTAAYYNTEPAAAAWVRVGLEDSVSVVQFGGISDANINTNSGTDASDAFLAAVKSGVSEVTFPDGNWFMNVTQISGDSGDSEYIGRSDISITLSDGATIVSNGYVGETPPSDQGVEWGFRLATISAKSFDRISISGGKVVGPFFANLSEDAKPYITGVQGTNRAYNTTSRFLNAYQCGIVEIKDITSSEYYGMTRIRESAVKMKNVTHTSARQSFEFQACTDVQLDNVHSVDARYSLDSVIEDGTQDLVVRDRATDNLLYTTVPTPGADEGAKLVSGYGFLFSGCNGVRAIQCTSTASGSNCFRFQIGPGSEQSFDNELRDCESIYPARYGFGDYSSSDNLGTTHINCKVKDVSDLTFYDGQPPATQSEALNPVVDRDTISTHWQFRLPRTTNNAFADVGVRTVFQGGGVYSDPDLRVNGPAALSTRYGEGFESYGMQGVIPPFSSGQNIELLDFEVVGQCESNNGLVQIWGGGTKFDGLTIDTKGGTSTTDIVVYALFIRDDAEDVQILNSKIKGAVYSLSSSVDPTITKMYVKNTEFDNIEGSGVFRVGPGISFTLNALFDSCQFFGPKLMDFGDDSARLNSAILSDCQDNTDALGSSSATGNANRVLFRSGKTYFLKFPIDGARHKLTRGVRFDTAVRLDANYSSVPVPDDEGAITNKYRNVDVTPAGAAKLATIYNDSLVSRELRVSVASAGSGSTGFTFSTDNVDVEGDYLVEYYPINFTESEVVSWL